MKKYNLIIILIFFYSSSFSQQVYSNNGKVGLMATDSSILLKPNYSKIKIYSSPADFREDKREENQIDDNEVFEEVVFEVYKYEIKLKKNIKYARAYAQNKVGLFRIVDNEIEEVLPIKYDDFDVFPNNLGGNYFVDSLQISLILLKKKGTWGIYSTLTQDLKKVNYKFEDLYFSDRYLSNNWVFGRSNGKWGIFHTNESKWNTSFVYEKMPTCIGLNFFMINTKNAPIKYIGMGKDGKRFDMRIYDSISKKGSNQYIGTRNEKMGVIDGSGMEILPCEYNFITKLWTNKYQLSKNGKLGLAVVGVSYVQKENTLGQAIAHHEFKMTIPAVFDTILPYNYVTKVKKDNKYGVYSDKGDLLLPLEYDAIEKAKYENPYFLLKKDNKMGAVAILDSTNLNNSSFKYTSTLTSVLEIPIEYEEVGPSRTSQKCFILKKNGKYGLQHMKNIPGIYLNDSYLETLDLPIEYDTAPIFPFILKKNNKWGMLKNYSTDSQRFHFKEVIPFEYDSYKLFTSTYCGIFEKDEKKGMISFRTFKVVLEFVYDDLTYHSDGVVRYKKGNETGLVVLKTGRIILDK